MDHELRNRFNNEVERYRRALIHYAKACEWEMFEKKAGIFFDYLESIERIVLERKFFARFFTILTILVAVVAAIVKMDGQVYPALLKYKNAVVLTAIAVSCFLLYFYVDFRMYLKVKISLYKKRREQFIKNIEKDFKEIIIPSLEKETIGLAVMPQQEKRKMGTGRSLAA